MARSSGCPTSIVKAGVYRGVDVGTRQDAADGEALRDVIDRENRAHATSAVSAAPIVVSGVTSVLRQQAERC